MCADPFMLNCLISCSLKPARLPDISHLRVGCLQKLKASSQLKAPSTQRLVLQELQHHCTHAHTLCAAFHIFLQRAAFSSCKNSEVMLWCLWFCVLYWHTPRRIFPCFSLNFAGLLGQSGCWWNATTLFVEWKSISSNWVLKLKLWAQNLLAALPFWS